MLPIWLTKLLIFLTCKPKFWAIATSLFIFSPFFNISPRIVAYFPLIPNCCSKKVKIIVNGKVEYKSAEEISSLVIKKVVQNAEDFIAETQNIEGLKITKAIITVPAHFNENQKNAVRSAAKMAGIEVPKETKVIVTNNKELKSLKSIDDKMSLIQQKLDDIEK